VADAATLDMAKPKAARNPEPEPEPEPKGSERKPLAIQVRGSNEWKAWAEELSKYDGSTLAGLVDRLLRQHARTIGFPKTPPER
jgi:hypothetical protein